MADLDEEIQDMASSNMSDLDDTPSTANAGQEEGGAVSSPATGEKEQDKELLDVVRDVVKENRPETKTASPAEGEEGTTQEESERPKKPDDENYTDAPFHKHPRFQQLLRERNSYKDDAGRYQNVVGFLDNAGLSAEEAADGLQIMGLAKTNPAEAWKQLRPWLEKLVVAAGEVLPPELQQRVQQGQLTATAAQEIARANARAASVEASQSFQQQRTQREQQANHVRAVQGAAEAWENDRLSRDPNFTAKQPLIMKEVLYLQRTEGVPNTPEGVRAQLKKAYDEVNKGFRPATPASAPQRQTVRPVTGGQVAGNQNPAPKSGDVKMLDIVNGVIAQRAG